MWSLLYVVSNVSLEHSLKVPTTVDQDVVEAEGHRNPDHARDLPIHESVLVRTTHGRRGSSMPETPFNARFLSLEHSSLG